MLWKKFCNATFADFDFNVYFFGRLFLLKINISKNFKLCLALQYVNMFTVCI